MDQEQRFLGVLTSSPFRIAIVYSMVFAFGAVVLLGAVYFAVSQVIDGSTDNLIEAEVQGLREQVLVLSRADFIALVEQRSEDQDVRGAVYLMVDPQLHPVAGNVPAWPTAAEDQGAWVRFKMSVPYGETTLDHEVRARRFPLPGGYRMLVGHDVQERQDVLHGDVGSGRPTAHERVAASVGAQAIGHSAAEIHFGGDQGVMAQQS